MSDVWGQPARGSQLIPDPLPWADAALCAQTDYAIFYPRKGQVQTVRAAKAVCRKCPVLDQCLLFALETDERHGIWGATTVRDRRRLRAGMPKLERALNPAKCGTEAQHKAHKRRGESCEPCRVAYNRAQVERVQKRKDAA